LARTVLLADDSVTAQNMGRRILMDAGYEVITVNNGSAALKKIHENPPDLIVLDVYMPGYGGLEVCQRLKESSDTMKIPVLLTVGKMEPFKTDEAKRVRADAHIVKPFEAGELLAALTRLEDRIVPQSDTRKRSKAPEPKKARFWHVDESDSAQAQAEWSEKIAYLAQVKQRNEETGASAETSPEQFLTKGEVKQVAVPGERVAMGEHTSTVAADKFEIPETTIAQAEPAPPSDEEPAEAVTFASASQPEAAETFQQASTAAAPEFAVQIEPAVEIDETPALASEPLNLIEPAVEPEAAPAVDPIVQNETRWMAENVPISAEEASLELDKEMQQAQAVAMKNLEAGGSEPNSYEPQLQVPVPAASVPANDQVSLPTDEGSAGIAFAAAASASAAVSAGSAEPPVISETTADAVPSEAAAAWQNWQQIRESVMSPQSASALAESVAEIAQSSMPGLTASESAPNDALPNPSLQSSTLDANALASIVDDVLAELKPRLMQEIAKKLKK
jgi:CheY-like chemotaxis protein